MDRRKFVQLSSFIPITLSQMNWSQLFHTFSTSSATPTMPALFLGHGSPMNAIEENEFVLGFRRIAKHLPKPRAILCVSAHWETRGTRITAMSQPKTIHDFGGFPKALFEVQYPAPGSPELAVETQELIKPADLLLDHEWGLDHGAWSVIKHLYPDADIPVVQLSLDRGKNPQEQYQLAQQLKQLRQRGVLIIGSGNMVHNLGMVAWERLNENYAYDWAEEASIKMKSFIQNKDHKSLIQFRQQGKSFDLSIPTAEHFLPLLYVLGVQEASDEVILFNDKALAGSLTMTSVLLQPKN
jgi:4,5-DOPA dioxygenase extradiol